MAKKSDNKMKSIAVSRYGWIVLFLFIIFLAIVGSILKIKYVEGDKWRKIGAKKAEKVFTEVPPRRGDIMSDDGRVLATSQPLYNIYMDFLADGIEEDSLMKYVTPLSQMLSRKFPQRTAVHYKKVFLDNWAQSRKEKDLLDQYKRGEIKERIRPTTRYVRIIPGDITYLDRKEIQTYPFWNQRTNKSGFIAADKTERLKPFGNLAGRTVGNIYKGVNRGGASGLELKFDSIIKGVPGMKARQRIKGRWIDVVEVEPKEGLSIKTTLNIEVQDMAERALTKKMLETQAKSGCAVIMEVESGEIKAIVNLDRRKDGSYSEGLPHVFSYMGEPGSTFKAISLLAALDDGVVAPTDTFYVGKGVFDYKGTEVKDHDWLHKKDKGYMTVTRGMEMSSNVLLSKMILKGYEKTPRKFIEKIDGMGLLKKLEWDVPLKGIEGTAIIRYPNDKKNPWSPTTLPWMSFGYETQVPPIYMLMFYNGIANNGKMIKPFLTKAFLKDGKVEKLFSAEVVNSAIANRYSIEQTQKILRSVVVNGTGKTVASEYFTIAGKTGTAKIASKGGYSNEHYISFCGYFPSDKPKYTCFVGVERPRANPAGGNIPGKVFKEIAEGVFFKDLASNPVAAPKDSVHTLRPEVKNGMFHHTRTVLNELDQKFKINTAGEWIKIKEENGNMTLDENLVRDNLVPNVMGMGARDAVYLLENMGLRVNLIGAGKVIKQTIPTGRKVVKGARITIELK